MIVERLIEHAVFKINGNDIYTQYLIPTEYSPLKEKDICGCWIFVFKTKELAEVWRLIYEAFKKVVSSNTALKEIVKFEEVHRLDEFTFCQNRGFNEAYTTDHYFEFLTDGDCEPNEWIIEHFNKLKHALDESYEFYLELDNQKKIICKLIERAFVKPNLELKWTDEPYPWTLYNLNITREEIDIWRKS